MSFILDALRKSDVRRQQSSAPGLNSPEPPRPPGRGRRRLWPLLGVALVVFGAAGAAVYVIKPGWLPGSMRLADEGVARQDTPPPDTAGRQAPEPAEDGKVAEAERRELAAQHGTESGNDRRRMPPREPAVERPAAPAGEAASNRPAPRRQPLAGEPDRSVRREAIPQRESEPVEASRATAELERRMAEEAQRRRQASERPADADATVDERRRALAQPEPDATRGRDTPTDQAAPAPPQPLNTGVAEYVRAWELPLSIRRNLPELDLTIHVFSPQENERFVLINGERYRAGDSIGEANIVDIRREGAIVDFRSHRFLLEPR